MINNNIKFIRNSISNGKRINGREMEEFRDVKVEKGVVNTAEGSARVTIGDTVVLAGVKLRVMEPYPDSPNEGSLMVDLEFVPFGNPSFETGPPKPEAVEMARVIDRGIRESKTIDTEKLCVKAGEAVWSANIDIHVMGDDGNLIDAGALAALAALEDANLLGYDLENKKILRDEKHEFPISHKPVAITVVKIGDTLILDPSLEEWKALDARITVTTMEDGSICSIQKGGIGHFTKDEVERAADMAIEVGKELRNKL
jgi:exosome complex component RRP42